MHDSEPDTFTQISKREEFCGLLEKIGVQAEVKQIDSDESGHEIRQKTRRILWDYSKRKFRQDNSHINLDKYRPPHEVKGIIKKIIIKLFKN